MSDPKGTALLVAVTRMLRDEVTQRNIKQSNGGNHVWWPLVATAMEKLTGAIRKPNRWRNRYRESTSNLSTEAIQALADSVAPETYAGVVRAILEGGEAPERAQEALDTAQEPNRPKKHKATAEELDSLSAEDIMGLADADIRIEQAEAKARVFKRLYEAAKQRAAFVSTACSMLHDIVQALPPVEWDKESLPAVHIGREQDAILVLSDIHIGDAIHPDTMGAINAYNYAIFQEKAKRLYAGMLESLAMFRESGNIRKLWVLGLGDWVTGTNIFPGQPHHIEFGAMKQAMQGADVMTRVIHEFLALPGIETIQMECVPGNHGRPGKKGQDPPEDNWDLVLYEFMKLRLANERRIAVNWHESWWMMPNIQGWNFLCAHGDEVRAWNGIPNYGFRRWGSKWREMLDSIGKRYDYGLIGHHHTEVEERNLIISGAWPGASFFSAKFLQSGGEATQMFYSVSQDYGITWRRRLPLDPPKRGETVSDA